MRLDCHLLLLVASNIALGAAPLMALDALEEREFRELQEQVRPSATEPWRTIPWRISLLEAQQVAAGEKKPIFIWAMDGHPLGCT